MTYGAAGSKLSTQETRYPIQYSRAKAYSASTRPTITAGSVAQGGSINVSVVCNRDGANTANFQNGELWLKINPNFIYNGSAANITIVDKGGDAWLILREDATVAGNKTYSIPMLVLQSAPTVPQAIFTEGYRLMNDSVSREYNLDLAPYKYMTISGRTAAELAADTLDINSNGRTDDAVMAVTVADFSITPSITATVTVMPGTGAVFAAPGVEKTFREYDRQRLTVLANIVGSVAALDNYDTVFHIPTLGSEEPGGGAPYFALFLRGPVRITNGLAASPVVSYQIGGSYYSEENVAANGGWDAVTDVKVHVATMPASAVIAMYIDLHAPVNFQLANNTGDRSWISGSFNFSGGSEYSSIEPARFVLQKYAIVSGAADGGYAFKDLNGNDIFDVADVKWSGLTAELYPADTEGTIVGERIAQTTTDASGNYAFTELNMGYYVVKREAYRIRRPWHGPPQTCCPGQTPPERASLSPGGTPL
jgi:hypothetical protein